MIKLKFLLLCFMGIFICFKIFSDEVESSPLIIQQERIQQLIIKLDDKFLVLSELLKIKEPENAKLLLLAFKKSKETLIQLKVESSIKFLKEKDLQKSIDAQQKIIDDLFGILNSLTSLDYSNRDEINKLEKMKEKIDKLIKDEFNLINESNKIENKQASAEKYAEILLKLEELIKASQITLKNTIENRVKGLSHLSGIAKNIERHSKVVEKIYEMIAGFPLESINSKTGNRDEAPIVKEDNNTKVENKVMEPGIESLKKAFDFFGAAEKSIVDGKPFSSEKSQKDAIESLIKTLQELQKEKERILSLPEDYTKDLSKNQDRIIDELENINDKNEKPNQNQKEGPNDSGDRDDNNSDKKESGDQSGGDKGEESSEAKGNDQKDTKGNTPFEKTKKYMEESSKDLKEKNISKAKSNQQKSIDELKKIKDEIEKTLLQLRKEEKEEKLAKLGNRFVEILNLEKSLYEQCTQLNAVKLKGEWTRNEKVKCVNLMQEQVSIKELVVRVEDILLEDASTIVFPDIVNQIKEDMMEVANLLKVENTGKTNQLLISEILLSLEELIDSLEKAREEAKKEAQENKDGKGQNDSKTTLISKSSELKLLKKLQLRINRMTNLYVDESKDEKSDFKNNVKRIYDRQKQVLDITKKMNERKQE